MLEVSGLHVSIKGKPVLHGVDMTVADGSVCAIIGPNGAGKSTLVKTVSGIIKPERGSVAVDGAPLRGTTRRELAQKLSYLPQTTTPVPCRVFDAVLLGRKPYIHWRPGKDDVRLAERVMDEMGLLPLRDACVTQISGGEFQKMLIARALVQEARILILDEPINHLDIKNQIEIMALIREITRSRKLTTMIVLHDLNLALRYSDSILLIQQGRQRYFGDSRAVSSAGLSDVYDIPISIEQSGDRVHIVY
jgi:iron complex transport system ATP-binding protein